MFNSLNKVTLIGKTSHKFPPELKVTPSGLSVLRFSLATAEYTKDKEGNKKNVYEYHRIVMFGKTAELAEKFIKMATLVYVEGKIKSGSYTDQTGKEIKTVDIIANDFVILDSTPFGEKGQAGEAAAARAESSQAPQSGGYDEDIPF